MKIYKIISAILISLTVSLTVIITLVHAETEEQKTRSLKNCVAGFQAFMSATAGFLDSIRTWDEIFYTNSCYRADLDGIGNQLRKVRRQVRAAYLRCDVGNVDRIIENYYKLDAELWFLRNAVDTKNGRLIEQFIDEGKSLNLQKKMQEEYSGVIDDALLQNYVTEFRAKYKGRFDNYRTCSTFQSLDELSEKWNDFVEAIGPVLDVFTEDTGEQREEAREAAREKNGNKTPSQAGPRDGPIISLDESLDLNLKIARLKVDPQKNFEDLAQQFKDDVGGPLPVGEVQAVVDREQRRVSEELSRGETWTRYRVMYGDIADAGTADIVASLDELLKIIPATVPSMLKVQSCAENLKERQCKTAQ